jgi:hypothetical protein
VIECFAASHGIFWALTGLLLLSEALGQTKLVQANGVLSFTVDIVVNILRCIRKALRP